ncbi:hypothetical protein [Archangium lipolyticum]|uniref:hypothetical protein n=1 Tax=Archangium lipolyticum TaxID=2970465 RepID=UPI00214A05D7|nr:hypothetical protein [Archangium lipolyticum]
MFWGASLVVGLMLSAFQAQASDDKAGSVQLKATESKVAVSQVKMTGGAQYKLSDMVVMLDGALYPMNALSKLEGRISIIVDDESLKTGVARAYRTTEEFDAYVAEKGAQCPNADVSATGTTEQCLFYDAADCTGWTLRLAVNCGNAAGSVGSLISIRSFSLGCGSTFVCPTTDCTGTCGIASGTAGACVNVTSGAVQCAGCANF